MIERTLSEVTHMRLTTKLLVNVAGAAICCVAVSAGALEPGQRPPLRLYSIGDSFTRAADANLPGDNVYASWVNGYRGTLQKLLGLPSVNSHNQRIDVLFGKNGRRNYTIAENGDSVKDMVGQAIPAANLDIDYATVMLGANDVCRSNVANLITDAEFEAHVRDGMVTLLNGLGSGATVLVLAIPNVKGVHDFGQVKKALGISSCERAWKLFGFCEAMLSENATELDRQYLQARNVGYNAILERLSGEMAASYPDKFVRYAPATFGLPTAQSQLSDIDCFHASWQGQKATAELTWPSTGFAQ
jgi:lysophospholipase L1-like esterase